MRGRWQLALRAGLRVALLLMWLQAAVSMALATALPEVGHRHAPGTPEHSHTLFEVGGVGVPALAPVLLPAPSLRPGAAPRRARGVAGRRISLARLGRGPPRRGAVSVARPMRPPCAHALAH